MDLKPVLLALILSAFLASTLNGLLVVSVAADVQRYAIKDVTAGVEIKSPIENGSYFGALVGLNANVHFSVFAYEINRGDMEIPYQEIEFLYSLDDARWQSIQFHSAKKSWCPSHNPGRYYDSVDCTYAVTLSSLPEGWHTIKVIEKPGLRSYSTSSSHDTRSIHFRIIKTAGLSVSSPQNKTYDSNEVALVFGVEEPSARIVYSLDNQNKVAIQNNSTLAPLDGGVHSLVVHAIDDSGNTIESVTVVFKVALPRTEASFPMALIMFVAMTAAIGAVTIVYIRKRKKV